MPLNYQLFMSPPPQEWPTPPDAQVRCSREQQGSSSRWACHYDGAGRSWRLCHNNALPSTFLRLLNTWCCALSTGLCGVVPGA